MILTPKFHDFCGFFFSNYGYYTGQIRAFLEYLHHGWRKFWILMLQNEGFRLFFSDELLPKWNQIMKKLVFALNFVLSKGLGALKICLTLGARLLRHCIYVRSFTGICFATSVFWPYLPVSSPYKISVTVIGENMVRANLITVCLNAGYLQ